MQHTKLQTFFLALMGIIPIFAETTNQRDSHFRQSSDIQPLSIVYSFAEDSPVDIQLPGFSITADSGSLKHSLDIVVTKLPHKAGVAMPSNMDNVSGAGDGINTLQEL